MVYLAHTVGLTITFASAVLKGLRDSGGPPCAARLPLQGRAGAVMFFSRTPQPAQGSVGHWKRKSLEWGWGWGVGVDLTFSGVVGQTVGGLWHERSWRCHVDTLPQHPRPDVTCFVFHHRHEKCD